MWCLFALVSLQFLIAASCASAERLKACGAEKRYRSARYQTPVFDKGKLCLVVGVKTAGCKVLSVGFGFRQGAFAGFDKEMSIR